MTNKNIIVIGASQGGAEAMRELDGGLPEMFPVAEHLESNNRGVDAAALLQEIEKEERKADLVRKAVRSE